MQGFIYSLILAAISALAFIAYRHHKAFMKIAAILYWSSLITYLAATMWNAAVSVTASAAIRATKYEQLDTIRQATDELQIPFLTLLVSFFLWMGYLTILRFLPDILHLGEKQREDR